VAPPATAAAAAAAAIPSAAHPADAATPMRTRRILPRRGAAILGIVSVAAVLVVAGAWFAWRSLSGPAGKASPPESSGVSTAPPEAAAPAPAAGGDSPGGAGGRVTPPSPAATARADGTAPTTRSAATIEMERELAAARARIDAREFDRAIADLKTFLDRHGSSSLAPEALLLSGRAEELAGRREEAMASYVVFRSRYKGHTGMPDATYRLAQVTGAQKGREDEAIRLYTEVFTQYPSNRRAPEAMFSKAEVQDRLKLRETDPMLSGSVPASLLTYRTLADRYPKAALTEHALYRIGNMYEDLKRYDLAAQAFEKLGAWFPLSRYDGWFRAGELYDRRLKNQAKAQEAYLKVLPSSPRYKDAQKRAGK
jgi:tetratricopeptide (TPR) repeat protein